MKDLALLCFFLILTLSFALSYIKYLRDRLVELKEEYKVLYDADQKQRKQNAEGS